MFLDVNISRITRQVEVKPHLQAYNEFAREGYVCDESRTIFVGALHGTFD